MNKIKILVLLMLLPIIIFAQEVVEQPDWVLKIIEAGMPFILLGVTAATKLKDKIPGIYMLVVVALYIIYQVHFSIN